jgi:hypothetical protein
MIGIWFNARDNRQQDHDMRTGHHDRVARRAHPRAFFHHRDLDYVAHRYFEDDRVAVLHSGREAGLPPLHSRRDLLSMPQLYRAPLV